MDVTWIAILQDVHRFKSWVFDRKDQVIAHNSYSIESHQASHLKSQLLSIITAYKETYSEIDVLFAGDVFNSSTSTSKTPTSYEGSSAFQTISLTNGEMNIACLPNVMQDAPKDYLAGDLVKIWGYLEAYPKFDGILCMTGAHSKWVHISAEEIVSFRSFMSGELTKLLIEKSTLSELFENKEYCAQSYKDTLQAIVSSPNLLAGKLSELMHCERPLEQRLGQLHGVLIGAELASTKAYWLGQQVVLLGEEYSNEKYKNALEQQGAFVEKQDELQFIISGFKRLYKSHSDKA